MPGSPTTSPPPNPTALSNRFAGGRKGPHARLVAGLVAWSLALLWSLVLLLPLPGLAQGASGFSTAVPAGRLSIGSSSFCGATLIAPRLVVTAAHCLTPGGRALDIRSIRFQTFGGRSSVGVAGIAAQGGYNHAGGVTLGNLAGDIAVLRLDATPPGGSIAVRGALGKGPLRLRPAAVAGVLSCALEQASMGPGGRLAVLGCPAYRGASGSGVFEPTPAGDRLVGVVSAGAQARPGRPAAAIIVRLDKASDVLSRAR